MKTMIRFLLSLSTAFGSFLAFVVLAVGGSFFLVNNLAFFSGIDEMPLFRWLAGHADLSKTWWIYAMVALLAVLAASTIACTVEAFLNRMSRTRLILKLSPQIMHCGVLLIMLGHLMTASAGFKLDLSMRKGEVRAIDGTKTIALEDVSVKTDEFGYAAEWEATIRWTDQGGGSGEQHLRPVRPAPVGPYGLFLKSVALEPEPSALIMVSRDPGAPWALLGGIVLCLGGIGFVFAGPARQV